MCHEQLRDFDDEINRTLTDIFHMQSGMVDCCEPHSKKTEGGLQSL